MRLLENLAYDAQSGLFIWLADCGTSKAGDIAGCVDLKDGYIRIGINGRSYLAHRLAWLAVYGIMPEGLLDHRNGNRSDNRIKNLRRATRAQNTQNSKVRSDSQSAVKGVRYHATAKGWQARITLAGKQFHLGIFPTRSEAVTAYRLACERYFAEFSSHLGVTQ